MAIRIQCPSPECRAACNAKELVSGRRVKCPKCGTIYVATPTLDGRQSDTNKGRPAAKDDPFPAFPAVFGRYKVLRLLGRGGMGAVYLAEDTQLGRQVALKLPFIEGADVVRVERFSREARSAAGLHHPNICTVYDAGTINGRPFITMTYVAGKPLDEILAADGQMPPRRAAEIVRGVARALAFAHQSGVVHRDLKPANVMVRADGEPVVMDFGLAKLAGDADAAEVKLTRQGGLVGTPSYMSPEQVRGDVATVGPASDVYSLGVVLFELLAGRPPYTGSMTAVLGQILGAPVPPVAEFRADVSAWLEAVCQQAMAKDVAARFPGMTDLARALDAYLEPSPSVRPQAPPPSPLTSVRAAAEPTPASSKAVTVDVELVRAPAPLTEEKPFDELTTSEPVAVATKSFRKPSVWHRPVLVAAGLLVPLVAWAAAVMFRVETPNGTIVVEITDPAVEARIKGGKLVLTGPDGKDRYTLTAAERDKAIDAGPYKVRVEGVDGLALDTTEFTVRKGDRVTVRVTLEPRAVQPPAGGPPPAMAPPAKAPPATAPGFTNDLGMEFVLVPRGKSWLGGGGGKAGETEVTVATDFYLGKYPVTQQEWLAATGKNPSHFSRGGPGKDVVKDVTDAALGRHPAENLTWDDCLEFVRRLNERSKVPGWTYRVPTAAEWEYACRGGPVDRADTGFDFYLDRPATTLGPDEANFGKGDQGYTTPVDRYRPNRLGLYDMHGNVHQWCDAPPAENPMAGRSAFRGGSFWSPPDACRAAVGGPLPPTQKQFNIGLRVARAPVAGDGGAAGPPAVPPRPSAPDAVFKSFRLTPGKLVRPDPVVGDTVRFQFGLKNVTSEDVTAVVDPTTTSKRPTLGHAQYWVERLGPNPAIPSAKNRYSRGYAIGGGGISPHPNRPVVKAGDVFMMVEWPLDTTAFAAGVYRVHADYRNSRLEVLDTQMVEFDLKPAP